MILGLDVSTSCTGWCVLHSNGTLMEMGYVPLEKLQETFKKAERLGDKLLELMIDYPLSEIVIEENLQAFRPGLSSARTLMTLARFNDVAYQWPVKILKSGPRKGLEILQPGCYDMADAYVIAKANLILNKR